MFPEFLNNLIGISQVTVETELTEFDPTNADSDYGEAVKLGGDAILNVVTEGAAGNAFSQGCEGIENLNTLTDNSFTAESIGEAASSLTDIASDWFGF